MAKAVDSAYRAIREGILAGTFAQGSHITARQLAEATGLSRTPVREAMRRLDAEGMISLIPNRGAFVASWSDNEIEQIYELRVLLESFAAQVAAERVNDAQRAELKALANEMSRLVEQRPVDVEAIAEVNDKFHKGVLDACGNPRLRDLLGTITEVPLQLSTFRRYSIEELRRSAAQHEELVSALMVGDGDWARSVMTAHIRSARHTLLQAPVAVPLEAIE
ncbi:GntR family transcriptional regulator [Sphingomonas sp. HITSZ_GF]|uniref:GntR family transcriptional regulator n=1 Tax=Sphingomonas sp. HITSZ_GF TaxID=3037247 RepID=UPI00240D0551|nr:GntR family transcriptional regulator [Sphingomonas sp. HITSZ_GF]MDG2533871.1 GntR family transcriptional regulator [Sphingomonas sp. HITSZ_GF]